MNRSFGIMRFTLLSLLLCSLLSCPGTPSPGPQIQSGDRGASQNLSDDRRISQINIQTFDESKDIRSAGLYLMDNPAGPIKIVNGEQDNDSVLVVAVHGYLSEGYEWITGIQNLAVHYGSLFFYRYDWDRCPDAVSSDLTRAIHSELKKHPYNKLVLFGHSYGGLVVTFAASQLGSVNTEINVIAAPLSGFSSLLSPCESLNYDVEGSLVYPPWKKSVKVIQHRTVHGQDGAFRDLEIDPQVIELPFEQVQTLPPTMDGHRLGHNWAVTWVLDQHVGKPHRY
ncbi:MAG: alpha/beta hydrolase [Candidatus Marinimicrobia bacterium]|nr:alpha/beta hydrolase [Candidatus Neomarinimicrobiota bacterium]